MHQVHNFLILDDVKVQYQAGWYYTKAICLIVLFEDLVVRCGVVFLDTCVESEEEE